jgi:hypothetical protein
VAGCCRRSATERQPAGARAEKAAGDRDDEAFDDERRESERLQPVADVCGRVGQPDGAIEHERRHHARGEGGGREQRRARAMEEHGGGRQDGSDALLPHSSALEAVLYFYAAGALIAYMLADREITRDVRHRGGGERRPDWRVTRAPPAKRAKRIAIASWRVPLARVRSTRRPGCMRGMRLTDAGAMIRRCPIKLNWRDGSSTCTRGSGRC